MLSFGISIASSLGLSIVPAHAPWILNLEVTESSIMHGRLCSVLHP